MTTRPYLAMIQHSVSADQVSFKEISPDYLYRVQRGNDSFIMHDVEVGLNNSSSMKLAQSKSGTYSVLHHAGVPAVEHHFLLNNQSRFAKGNAYDLAAKFFQKHNEKVVLKQDNGSQGVNVFKIETSEDLKAQLSHLFSLQLNACLSPFYTSTYEYRMIVLKGEVKLLLAKERLNSWKHNLIGGSRSKDVPTSLIPTLSKMATQTAHALQLDFCSVDILDTTTGLLVLEVNEQVMLDEYIKDDPTRKDRVSAIYREAILERLK
ncbi:ATP-grasp domain-containing protein [Halalkalibacter akibai]|nr:hypothetical protein [Halalkalibacter akibai]